MSNLLIGIIGGLLEDLEEAHEINKELLERIDHKDYLIKRMQTAYIELRDKAIKQDNRVEKLSIANHLLGEANDKLNLELRDLNKINEEFNDKIGELQEENKHLIISNYLLKDVLSCTEIVINIKKEKV